MNPYTNPSVSDFKNFFQRDFPYTNDAGTLTGVNDTDITNALQLGFMNINSSLFPMQQNYTIGNLYLSAHFLVMAIRQGTQGITGNYPWLESSKSVGPAAQGFSIPEGILKDPLLSMYTKTYYGLLYINFILPYLRGNAGILYRRTNP